MISYVGAFSAGAGTVTSIATTLVNCTALNIFDANLTPGRANISTGNTTSLINIYAVTVTAANASFSFTANSTITTPNWVELFVQQMPNPIN